MIGILGEVIAHKHVEMVFKHVLVISWFLQVVVESNVVPLFRIRNAIKRIAQLTVLLLIGILGVFALNHANLMVEQLVILNVTEPFSDNRNITELLVLQKSLTDIKAYLAMTMTAVLIVKLEFGAHGATAVSLVVKATYGEDDQLSHQNMVMVWIVLNSMKLISVPTILTALPNAFMVKILMEIAQLLVVLLIMIIIAKLHV